MNVVNITKMNVAYMRIPRWMCRHSRRDMIRNEVICSKVGLGSVVDKLRYVRLIWFRHVKRRCADVPVKRCERLVGIGFERD